MHLQIQMAALCSLAYPLTPHKEPVGVTNSEQSIKALEKEIQNRLSPPIKLAFDVQKYKAKEVIRILIPKGEDTPYALDDYKIYVRDETETNIAVRDEIVNLVNRIHPKAEILAQPAVDIAISSQVEKPVQPIISTSNAESEDPRTGVEVIEVVIRGGKSFYTMRDLRNGNIVKNVTQASARRLWHYAITKYGETVSNLEQSDIQWRGNYGLIKQYSQGKNQHYDFILRLDDGFRYFFGVTPDGIHGNWKVFSADEE